MKILTKLALVNVIDYGHYNFAREWCPSQKYCCFVGQLDIIFSNKVECPFIEKKKFINKKWNMPPVFEV